MPRRDDLTILIIGSGPIVIGQGCEFDYSGTQACKALRGWLPHRPGELQSRDDHDRSRSDRTYIEPITLESVERIIIKEAANGTPIDALR